MILKLMSKEHVDRVTALEAQIAVNPWSKAMFQEELNLGSSYCIVLA